MAPYDPVLGLTNASCSAPPSPRQVSMTVVGEAGAKNPALLSLLFVSLVSQQLVSGLELAVVLLSVIWRPIE